MNFFSIIFILALLIALSARFCYQAPVPLIWHATSADRIVVTNIITELCPGAKSPYPGFSMTITGDQAKKIIHAIFLVRNNNFGGPMTASVWDWQLQFYLGTKLLDTARFQGSAVLYGHGAEYIDRTGTLDELYRHLERAP